MALKSRLFQGDAALQACLVNDASHLTPGSRGEHVAKVQRALDALGGEHITDQEVKAKTYGPSTAAAVMAYKRNRNIINHAYQSKPDNIVGKMTIASLDKEMMQVESTVNQFGCSCRFHNSRNA